MSLTLVTGGAGFIGSQITKALLDDGMDVRVVDAYLADAHGSSVRDQVPRAEYLEHDIADLDSMVGAAQGVDVVYHQAAKVGLGVSFDDVDDYVRHNDLGTAVLLKALSRVGFKGCLVVASSMVIYGEGAYRCAEHGAVRVGARPAASLAEGVFDHLCPECGDALEPVRVTEEAPPDPRNVYAATKLHQEHLCFTFGRELNVPVICLRYHNVYGPGMPRNTPYAGVASIFRSEIEAGRSPKVFEDGTQMRDFIHVDDVARANVLAAHSDGWSGALNVATGRPISILEIAERLADSLGPESPRPVVTGDYRLGDVRHVFASADKARSVLGFEARITLEEGLASMAAGSISTTPI